MPKSCKPPRNAAFILPGKAKIDIAALPFVPKMPANLSFIFLVVERRMLTLEVLVVLSTTAKPVEVEEVVPMENPETSPTVPPALA